MLHKYCARPTFIKHPVAHTGTLAETEGRIFLPCSRPLHYHLVHIPLGHASLGSSLQVSLVSVPQNTERRAVGVFALTDRGSHSQEARVESGKGRQRENFWQKDCCGAGWPSKVRVHSPSSLIIRADRGCSWRPSRVCSHLPWLPLAQHHCLPRRIAGVWAVQNQVPRH